MKKVILVMLLPLMAVACSNHGDAVNALTKAGFSEVDTHGADWFGCSKDDFYATKFTAKNPNGAVVSGTVCSGFLFKNSTVRF